MRPNVGTQDKYVNRIRKSLIDPMLKDTEKQVNSLFEQFAARTLSYSAFNSRSRELLVKLENKYGRIYARQAEMIAKDYYKDIKNNSKIEVKRNLKLLSMGVFRELKTENEAAEEGIIAAFIGLVVGIPSFYYAKLKKEVSRLALTAPGSRAVPQGRGSRPDVPQLSKNMAVTIEKYMRNQRRITKKHAENDVRNNYRLSFDAISDKLMGDNGLDEWQWIYTFRSESERPWHRDNLNNTIHANGNPPIIEPRTGKRGYPGQLPFCKCLRRPVRAV